MNLSWILIPFLSAFAGWLANRALFFFLFHPLTPKRFPGFSVQGILPAKQRQLAKEAGELVNRELVDFNEIEHAIAGPGQVQRIMPQIEAHIDHFLRVKLKDKMPVISMFIGDKTINELKTIFLTELQELFPAVMGNYVQNLRNELDPGAMVATRLSGISLSKLETTLKSSMGRELRMAAMAGAAIGLLVGMIQVALMCWLG